MIITDYHRREIRYLLEHGDSKSKVLFKTIKQFGLYKGYVDSHFIKDKKDLEKAIDIEYGKNTH